jgi:UDP-N-acetyl-D-glucosamine dehydrogenase
LNRAAKPLNGSRILLLGLAYKRNTGDSRESPGRVIVELLRRAGAVVSVADPHVVDLGSLADSLDDGLPALLVDPSPEVIASADAVVLVTDHDAFDLQGIARQARYLLDTRGRVSGPNVERL